MMRHMRSAAVVKVRLRTFVLLFLPLAILISSLYCLIMSHAAAAILAPLNETVRTVVAPVESALGGGNEKVTPQPSLQSNAPAVITPKANTNPVSSPRPIVSKPEKVTAQPAVASSLSVNTSTLAAKSRLNAMDYTVYLTASSYPKTSATVMISDKSAGYVQTTKAGWKILGVMWYLWAGGMIATGIGAWVLSRHLPLKRGSSRAETVPIISA